MFKTMIVKSIGGGIALAILLLSSTGLKAAVTHSGGSAMQQQQPKTRILSGTVLDAVTNEPVIGAAVQVRGRQGGEITDLDGMFTIEVPSGAVITVTSLGYRSQSLNVGTRDNIRILLEPVPDCSFRQPLHCVRGKTRRSGLLPEKRNAGTERV